MSHINAENKNYLLRLVNPYFFLGATYYFIRALFKSINRRLFKSRFPSEFVEIKKLRAKLIKEAEIRGQRYFHSHEFGKSYKIKLAVNILRLSSVQDWHTKFDDIEITVSIHRWNWLLIDIDNEPNPLGYNDGLFLIRSWCSQFIVGDNFTSEAYTIGERISNAVIFFQVHKKSIPEDIHSVLDLFSRQVVEKIEYFSHGLTGNHAFNNARALYLFSDRINYADLRKFAIIVFKERLPNLVSEFGFMTEGSSHYHFLFTRWVLELIWKARSTDDKEVLQLLNPLAKKLIKNCWTFLTYGERSKNWQIPIIGDISPDCSPQWLISLPWSILACSLYKPRFIPKPPEYIGWSKLFGGIDAHNLKIGTLKSNFSSNCGWNRIEMAGWTLFSYAPSNNGHMKSSHAHLDLCGFALYYLGDPIIIDIGRFDYTNSSIGRYGRSGEAHSSLTIDGLSPQVDNKFWMNPSYVKIFPKVIIDKKKSEIHVTIYHDGFKRGICKKLSHKRQFVISKKSLIVYDLIEGNGKITVSNFFNFGQGIVLRKSQKSKLFFSNGMIFLKDINSNNVKKDNQKDRNSEWSHTSYGIRFPIERIELKTKISLPGIIKNKILLNDQ